MATSAQGSLSRVPGDGAARWLAGDLAGQGRPLGFRIDRLTGNELLLERLATRYLARVVEGTTSGLRVGARVRLALEGALPEAAAGPAAAVRARIIGHGGRETGTVLELRPHLGPRPMLPAETGGRPLMTAVGQGTHADGQRLTVVTRPNPASGAPVAAASAPLGAQSGAAVGPPTVSLRVQGGVAGLGDFTLQAAQNLAAVTGEGQAVELAGARSSALGPPQSAPGEQGGLRLSLASGSEPASTSQPAPAAALGPLRSSDVAAASAAGLSAALLRLETRGAARGMFLANSEDELADALVRLVFGHGRADSDAPAAAKAADALAVPRDASTAARPATSEPAWLRVPAGGEAAFVESIAEENEEADDTGGPADRRLRIDLDLSRLGRVRLELACVGRARHLLLRSERPLAPECLAEIADLFGAALAISGRPGRFVAGRLVPARPETPPAAAGRTGLWA